MSKFKRMIQTHRYQKEPYINKYELITWDDFLLKNLARPYQLNVLENAIEGLTSQKPPSNIAKDNIQSYYTWNRKNLYCQRLAEFCIDVEKASGGAGIKRLEAIYNSIYIPDYSIYMTGYDLQIINLIQGSKIEVVFTLEKETV
jgi:hypothetical protein